MSVVRIIKSSKGGSKLTMCLPMTTTSYLRSVKALLEECANDKRISEKLLEFYLFSYFYAGKDFQLFTTFFGLPSLDVIKDRVSKWRNTPGLLEIYFQSLAIKTQGLDDKSKLCILSVAEFPVTPSFYYNITTDQIIGTHRFRSKSIFTKADTVLVFMVQSLTSNWKQPLGYFFIQSGKVTSMELQTVLQTIVSKLKELQLIVTAFIVPAIFKYEHLNRSLSVHETNNYFAISGVDRIQFLYDTGTILTILWKVFLKHIVFFDGHKASLSDLFITQTNPIFINFLNELTNTENKNASEIFTERFRELLHSFVLENSEKLPNGLNIYNMFKMLKRIYEMFSIEFIRPYVHYGEDGVVFLQKSFKVLNTIRILTRSGFNITPDNFPLKCLLNNIKGISIYWETLKTKNVLSLATHKLTTYEITKFNNAIQCGPEKNIPPTPRTFNVCFKKWFTRLYFKHLVPKIQDANLKFLQNTEEMAFLKPQEKIPKLLINTSDYKKFDLYDSDAMKLISAYMYKKCIENHKTCLNSICEIELKKQESRGFFINDPEFGVMVLPPKGFELLVVELESFYANTLNLYARNNNVGMSIYTDLMKKIKITFCPTFPLSYLIKLFLRIRIYYSLKSFNSIKL